MKKSLRNSLLIAGATTTIGLSSLIGINAVSAKSDNSNLVDKIATKFNLNKSEVQEVFEIDRKEHQEKHRAVQAKRLQKLVDSGTITEKQKSAIEAKLKEVREDRDEKREEKDDLDEDDHKQEMEEHRAELEAWARDEGIDLSKLKGVFMPGGHRGPGGPPPMNSNH